LTLRIRYEKKLQSASLRSGRGWRNESEQCGGFITESGGGIGVIGSQGGGYMHQGIPFMLLRGGTSKGVFFADDVHAKSPLYYRTARLLAKGTVYY